MILPGLLLLSAALSLYDLHTRRIPNWVTLPLLAAGLLAHFPAAPEIWLGCLFFLTGWRLGWLGGGDAKLWLALLWLTPADLTVASACYLISCAFQLAWRRLRRAPLNGMASPAAWRTLPYVLWLMYVH